MDASLAGAPDHVIVHETVLGAGHIQNGTVSMPELASLSINLEQDSSLSLCPPHDRADGKGSIVRATAPS